jgi:hypothetical protein
MHPKAGYKLANGTRVPGVTTITGRFKDCGGLLYWACLQGQAIERGEISKLYDKRDEAAESGTLAHSFVEQYLNGKEPPYDTQNCSDEVVSQAHNGFENFLNWYSGSNFKIISQEEILISEKYRFGGSPDAIAQNMRGELVLIDWKTSSGLYSNMLWQVAAYKALWEENYPGQPINGGFDIIRFSKEFGDFEHRHFNELDDAWEMFKLLRQAYDLDKKLKKRI